jgi:hypothetical protein
MVRLPTRTKRRNAPPDTPYSAWSEAETDAALSKLVGFDVAGTRERFWEWLADNGFGTRIYAASLGRNIVADVQVPKKSPSEKPLVVKARAILNETHSLSTLAHMYGPERLAGRRWHRALADLIRALGDFVPRAAIREAEDSFFASRESSGHYRRRVLSVTGRLVGTAGMLKRLARTAQRRILVYENDPLPAFGSGQPNQRFLARLETRLSLEGFQPAELARLIRDSRRGANNSAAAQRAHRERITSRIKSQKPAIVTKKRQQEIADASFDEFKKRTRLRGRDAVRKWLASPEYEALEARQRQLDEEMGGE